jgi:hypothetical protein
MIYGPFSGVLSERKSDPNDGEVWLQQPGGEWRYRELEVSISHLEAAFPAITCGTPTKVTVDVAHRAEYQDGASFVRDFVLSLTVGGVIQSMNLADAVSWPTTQTVKSYEFTVNLPSAADFAAGDVGAVLKAEILDMQGIANGANVFDVAVTVED